jgi:hypothetical protein
MIEENRITADQAALLLNSLEERRETAQAEPAPSALETRAPVREAPAARSGRPSWFNVQVTDTNSGKAKVHVRLPLSLVGWGLKLGSRYTDELSGVDLDELMEALRSGEQGKLIEVTDEEDGEHVIIFVE